MFITTAKNLYGLLSKCVNYFAYQSDVPGDAGYTVGGVFCLGNVALDIVHLSHRQIVHMKVIVVKNGQVEVTALNCTYKNNKKKDEES